jgi:hypothetical protein
LGLIHKVIETELVGRYASRALAQTVSTAVLGAASVGWPTLSGDGSHTRIVVLLVILENTTHRVDAFRKVWFRQSYARVSNCVKTWGEVEARDR